MSSDFPPAGVEPPAVDSPFQPSPGDDESGDEKSLRPRRLSEFVGQRRVVDNLRLAIRAALEREESLDHLLLSGMPGLGKTTLALLVAAEMGAGTPKIASGPTLERGKDL